VTLVAFAAPILPGKREQWDAFIAEITGPRRNDFDESRRRLGVRERTFLQETPGGDVVIVTLEAENPLEAFGAIANADDDFTRWFVQQVLEIHGFDLRQPPEHPPHLIVDTGATSDGGTSLVDETARFPEMWAQLIRTRLKPGTGSELDRLSQLLRSSEEQGSGLLRSTMMRDQNDLDNLYMLVVFESEAKARAREADQNREVALRDARALMGDIFASPPEFTDLNVAADVVAASGGVTASGTGARDVLRRVVEEVLNGKDLSVIDEVFAPNFVEHEAFPGLPANREGTRQLFAMLHAGFPDLHVEVDDMVVEGDRVMCRETWHGTQTGEFLGIPPTGTEATWQVYDAVRVADGKAVEHWGLLDQLSVLQQLGVVPAPDATHA